MSEASFNIPKPVGESVRRVDGVPKVTGAARYTGDLTPPGTCHAAIVRSPYPHAIIKSIESSAARRYPGVVAVVTAEDLADVHLRFGQFMTDRPLIASKEARFVGEPVVGVVAENPYIAAEAAALVEIEYEQRPHVIDPALALAPDAPVVSDASIAMWFREDDSPYERFHPNLCSTKTHAWGDARSAMAGAYLVLEGEYRFPRAFTGAMEQFTAIAQFEGGALRVWTAAGHPAAVRSDLARCFSLPLARVHVIVPYVGGSFGGKSYAKIEPLVAALALRSGRTVKLALSIDDAMLTNRSSGAVVHLRTGFDRDGRIVAREAELWLDSGAYADSTPGVTRAAATRLSGPYRIPALRVDAHAVYTNTVPAGSFRGFGAQESVWASEQQLDEAAEGLGIDAVQIRLLNLADKGERLWSSARPLDADLKDDLTMVANRLGWGAALSPGHGHGIALTASDAEVPNSVSVVMVRVLSDGSLSVLSGSTELGQGSQTVLAQIAAAEMGVALEAVDVLQSHTGAVPFERSTGASRTTTFVGRAVQAACADARQQLLSCAAEAFDVQLDQVVLRSGGVEIDGISRDWAEVVRTWFGGPVGEIVGRGYIRQIDELAESPPFWEIGCVGVEVAIDDETGVLRVEQLVTLADVGLAINPQLMAGQDAGAATMGMGLAMYEELLYDEDGLPANFNAFDYRVPRTTDLPQISSLLVQRQDGIGPYGAKGAGEGTLNPVAPAISNAIARARGVRMTQAPITPQRLWRALHEAEEGS